MKWVVIIGSAVAGGLIANHLNAWFGFLVFGVGVAVAQLRYD